VCVLPPQANTVHDTLEKILPHTHAHFFQHLHQLRREIVERGGINVEHGSKSTGFAAAAEDGDDNFAAGCVSPWLQGGGWGGDNS
jgi:hypothetical protein